MNRKILVSIVALGLFVASVAAAWSPGAVVEAVRSGTIGAFIPFDRDGRPVQLRS